MDDTYEGLVRALVRLVIFPFTKGFDELLIRMVPEEFSSATEHLINSRIEFLKSVKVIIDGRIESYEKLKEKLKKEVKREKVPVE